MPLPPGSLLLPSRLSLIPLTQAPWYHTLQLRPTHVGGGLLALHPLPLALLLGKEFCSNRDCVHTSPLMSDYEYRRIWGATSQRFLSLSLVVVLSGRGLAWSSLTSPSCLPLLQPQDDYSVLFEDTSYADGYSPPLNVAQRYVVACKEPKKK